jgi:hypothetical protein
MNATACLALFLVAALQLPASPLADLASPDQATRDAAAKILRASYQPPPRTKWEPLLAKLTPGLSGKELRKLLMPYPGEGSASGGGGTTSSFRLDDAWELTIATDDRNDGALMNYAPQLSRRLRQIWVAPPKNYTGVWTTYYVNGQKGSVIDYRNGQYFGTFTSYHSNGFKGGVQHFDETGCNGEEIDYYPSGRISARGQYTHNRETGTWTWYNEDGSIQSTEDYTAHPLPH